ncbi:MAG: Crp/Fnr family transcriptional regulator [Granulosicoccaceae bacterium]
MENTESLLKQVDLFAGLDDQSLALLMDQSRTLKFRKNTILMAEGDTGESLYIIKSGSIKIYVSDEQGGEMTLFIEGPGSYVGEISLLDGAPRTASAMALENTEVLMISKSLFYECIANNPDIAFGLIRIVSQRLRKATDDLRNLALKNVYQRLASKLIELSAEQDGVRVLTRKYSQDAFAKMIGASREMVGKILQELEKGGFIEFKDGKIHLLKTLPHDF